MAAPAQRINKSVQAIFENAIEDIRSELQGQESKRELRGLRRGDCEYCDRLRCYLAQRAATYLSRKDRGIRGIYSYNPNHACGDYESSYEGVLSGSSLHLIAWIRTKSLTLSQALQRFTDQWQAARAQFLCPRATALCLSLNVAVVNDREVRARRGYASMLGSVGVRPTLIWSDKDREPARRLTHKIEKRRARGR